MSSNPLLAPVQIGPATWDWRRTYVFGVVNVTPDSFFDGGRYREPSRAVEHGLVLVQQGADALDIGGESTRPGAKPVSLAEELQRVVPVVERLASEVGVPISVDTYKAEVARAAVRVGASIINDVSGGLKDESMLATVAELGATIIIGHMRGDPATMQQQINFGDVVAEVISELRARVRQAIKAGISAERIWIDPGIGFGKTAEQSMRLLKSLGEIREAVGYPVLVGPSRKSFIGEVTGQPAEQRLMGTCAASAAVVLAGADAVRLHDVEQLVPGIRVADAISRVRSNV
jgi:dihydropteroate synthase